MKDKLLNYELYECNDPNADWVVFVHGAGGSTKTWGRQIGIFKRHFNLLILDLRDHGNSKNVKKYHKIDYSFKLVANDVIELLDHLKLTSVHMLGVSVGSVVIRTIEQQRPDLLKSIVLAGGMFKVNPKIGFLLKTGIVLSTFLPYSFIYQLFAHILMPRKNHSTSRRIFIQESIKIQQHEFNKWMVLCKDISKVLKGLFKQQMPVPCLVVMGAQDHVFLAPAKAYTEKYSNTELEVIDNCGHVCSIEKASTFNQLAIDFLLAQR